MPQSLPEYSSQLKIFYNDDADNGMAGQGLQTFPLMNAALQTTNLDYWMMSPSEQVAMVFLLEHLRPKVAIEIGTRLGGSLQVLARFSERVYSIDIDREVSKRLAGKHDNVEYLTGASDDLLPPLIERLQGEQAELGFALVDGDHSADGVRKDIDNLLRFRPSVPFYIVMHDSFNPACREGLREARWGDNPFVHAVELDFVVGVVNPAPAFRDQLWGGLALAILLPHERAGRFEITARAEQTLRYLRMLRWGRVLRRTASKAKHRLVRTL